MNPAIAGLIEDARLRGTAVTLAAAHLRHDKAA